MRNRIKRQFEKGQQEAFSMTCSLLVSLNKELESMMDVEQLTTRLQRLRDEKSAMTEEDRREKLVIWERMKVWSFAKIITAIYAQTLLYLLVKIQVNIIGRNIYMDSLTRLHILSTDVSQKLYF
jgi:peroxin-3